MSSRREAEGLLEEGSAVLGIKLSRGQLDLFSRYLDELMRWNRVVNLVGPKTAHEVVINHMLDSIAGLTILRIGTPLPTRAVDIGAGAGFPGLPLKLCCPDLFLTLIEARKRKAAFLFHLVGHLGLAGVKVVAERSEQVALDPRYTGMYDLALVRAVDAPDAVADLARPLLGAAGRLLLYLGPTGTEKAATWPPPGYRVATSKRLILPFTKAKRTLLLLVRT